MGSLSKEQKAEYNKQYRLKNAERLNLYLHERYERLRREHLCVVCSKPTNSEYALCLDCSQKRYPKEKEFLAKRKAMGLCKCGNKLDGLSRCKSCSEKHKPTANRRRRQRIASGLCGCGKPNSGFRNMPTCIDCWFGSMAARDGGTYKNGPAVKKILENQNYKCAYTGRLLVPGKNASLDHIIPVSKNGKSVPENYQWLDQQVNHMKTDMTQEEFIATMKLILTRFNVSVP